MSKFLFTVWPFPGHINPNLAIAHALLQRGHDVAFYTDGSLRHSLEKEGFRCFSFQRVDGARAESMVMSLDAMSLQSGGLRQKKELLREWLLGTAEAQVEDLADVTSEWRADALVCDPAMWGPLLIFRETAGIPLAIMSYVAACMLPGPEGPILGLPLPRARGPLTRLGRRVLRSVAAVLAADVRRGAEDLRTHHGLDPMGTSVTAFAGRTPLYLVSGTPLYDRERSDLPRSVHYVGPCQWDPPGTATPDPWLAKLAPDRPLVYVTEGTMHSKPAILLRAALRGLAELPISVIATTGKHRDPEKLGIGTVPPNARVERWVPHSYLLSRTAVVVTTGGTGTVLAALSAGVPIVVVPMAWDQPENAWRIAESGAGIRLAPARCTPERVRDAVSRVLSDGTFRQNAKRLSMDFTRYGGAAQAAGLLIDLAEQRGEFARREKSQGKVTSSREGSRQTTNPMQTRDS